MRVVADTNTIISGVLWHGTPRQILDAARTGKIILYTSPDLLTELGDVLARPKFAERLKRARVSPRNLVIGYGTLAIQIKPQPIPLTILDDPEDDAVLACALSAHADAIASGDRHLLMLKKFLAIPILSATELLERVNSTRE